MELARVIPPEEIRKGLSAEFERDVTTADIEAFAAVSGDWNPLHMVEDYAASTNYGRRIVHGAFQTALASAMVGMYLPGRNVVVGSFQSRYPAPLFYPGRVRVQGEVITWDAATVRGVLRVRIIDLSSQQMTAEVHVGFSLHESGAQKHGAAVAASGESALRNDQQRPVVLVTGASGGIGGQLVEMLADQYQVVGLSRQHREPGTSQANWCAVDITGPDWELVLDNYLGEAPVYGIVHTAWPQAAQGGLLDAEEETIRLQLEFGGVGIIRLARYLKKRATGAGRLIVLGTTAATLKPLASMSAYSLGKAALEHSVRLLAPEMARSNITVNIVAPSFVPIGMNSAKTSRVVLTETAKVPLGRLCEPSDIGGCVRFLLSEAAGFVTGQMIPLTGGQL